MVKHNKKDCEKVAIAMKKWCEYALYAIKSEDRQDCRYCLNQVRQLLSQLEREHD